MVKLEQEQGGLPEFGTELANPDLAAVARAMGLHGVRVEDAGRSTAAVREAFAQPGPVLLDVDHQPRRGRAAAEGHPVRRLGLRDRQARRRRSRAAEAMDSVALEAGDLRALFAPEAGMICHSLRQEGEELLTQRDGVEGYARSGRTMGVPLLHPWANRLARWDYEALGHATWTSSRCAAAWSRPTVRPGCRCTAPCRWRGRSSRATPTRLTAERTPADDEGFRAAFPFPHRIRIEAELSPGGLRIATTLEALEGEVPVAFGFHPYVTLPGVARADYEVEIPPMRRLALNASKVPTGATEDAPALAGALGDRDLDDGFDSVPDGAAFAVAGGGRRVVVRFEHGYPCAQVFAPPGKDLICFEPMTAPGDALRTGAFAIAEPGRPYAAAFTIAVDSN